MRSDASTPNMGIQTLADRSSGKSLRTAKHPPWKLKLNLAFDNLERAQRLECNLKSGSGHAVALRAFGSNLAPPHTDRQLPNKRPWRPQIHPYLLFPRFCGIIPLRRVARVHLKMILPEPFEDTA